MSYFDEWFKKTMPNTHKGVGKKKIETFTYQTSEDAWDTQQQKIDELQKRIEDAINTLEQSKPSMMRQYDAIQALEILKGEPK